MSAIFALKPCPCAVASSNGRKKSSSSSSSSTCVALSSLSFSSRASNPLVIGLNNTSTNTSARTDVFFLAKSQSHNHSDTGTESESELECYVSAAREALSQHLHGELGLSAEEAAEIARNAPKYVEMVVEGARELEHLQALGMMSAEDSGEDLLGFSSFRDRVAWYLRNNNNNINMNIPFLESIGLSLPSAINVSRHLPLSNASNSNSLPFLIRHLDSLARIFFSSSNSKSIGNKARRLMMHLSAPIAADDPLHHTLSFFEKIEARRGGLDMLGHRHASLGYLLESFPRLLLLSQLELAPLLHFLHTDVGISPPQISTLLLLYPPVVFHDIDHLRQKLSLLQKTFAVDDGEIAKVLLKYPWVLSSSIQHNYQEIQAFFDKEKVPKLSVDHAIKSWPLLLGCSTGKLKLMVRCFGELSVRNKLLGKVIAKSPQLLLRKPEEFFQVVSLLERQGFDKETVGKILGRCPEVFAASIDITLKRKLEFLRSIGISENYLPRVIKKYPEVLVSDVDRTLVPRMSYLADIGLSKREIAFMVRRFSPLLGYSIQKVFTPKLDFLVNTMKKPLKEIVDYPRYFSYSLEKKIKPRYWVLRGRKLDCTLKDMLSKNDEEFAAEFMGIERMLIPPSHH